MEELLKQEKCIVAFIDILGVSAKIKESAQAAIQDIWIFCHRVIKTTNNTRIKVKIFSDNIFLCASLEQGEELQVFKEFFTIINEIESTMINLNSSFVRGAIVVGKVHFEDNFVLGEALLKAYEIESKVAIFPRIVIDETVFEYIKRESSFFKKDMDGFYFYDFLNFAGHTLTNPKTGEKTGRLLKLPQFKANILGNYKKNKNNYAVLQKMNWLKQYFNDYCAINSLEYVITDEEIALIEEVIK